MSENKELFALIEQLSKLCGTSGDEYDVREFIKSRIPAECTVTTDSIGNLIVFRKGKKTPKNKIMYCAHMDEVGFIVTDISDDDGSGLPQSAVSRLRWYSGVALYLRTELPALLPLKRFTT